MSHNVFMEQAIKLAKKGKWSTAPNPCVGAVLTHKGNVIATGYHTGYGKPHAEIECLLNAIQQGVFLESAVLFSNPVLVSAYNKKTKNTAFGQYTLSECTLYVTLEPCNHEGKTPPCTTSIIESGIKHVVIGLFDPNPEASGGVENLKKHGIHVEVGVLENECKELVDDFLVWQKQRRPYVILKMATSLDGRIGPNSGHNHQISGDESHKILMQLRENIGNNGGAILVGANTFLRDNPKLTARTQTAKKQPYAVIVGSKLPMGRELVSSASENNDLQNNAPKTNAPNKAESTHIKSGHINFAHAESFCAEFFCIEERAHETLFYCSLEESTSPNAHAFKEKGISVKGISHNRNNENNKGLNLKEVLEHLYIDKACPYVLCEGGPRLGLSLLEEGLVDELILYMAPIIMGDDTAKPVFLGRIMDKMTDAIHFNIKETMLVGSDIHIHLKPEQICLQD